MKLGVSITAFNEKRIKQVIEQYYDIADRIVVAVSTRPWFGDRERDDTLEKALETKALVMANYWEIEHDQRNDTMALLRDCDYVIVSHCDTFFTKEDLIKIKDFLKDATEWNYTTKTLTYWKDFDTVIDPDISLPTLIVRGDAIFNHIINIECQNPNPAVIDATCHHVSWVKSYDEIQSKIESYSHALEIDNDWIDRIWYNWNKDMKNIGPTNPLDFKGTRKHPLPESIRRLISKS